MVLCTGHAIPCKVMVPVLITKRMSAMKPWEENTNYQLGTKYQKDRYQTEVKTSLINNDMYYYPDTISRDDADSVL